MVNKLDIVNITSKKKNILKMHSNTYILIPTQRTTKQIKK